MMMAAGSEDGILWIMDLSTSKTSHFVPKAHSESISTLSFDPNGIYLYTGSHDGMIKSWDMRNLSECTTLTQSGLRKFDEGVLSLMTHPWLPLIAASGADSVIWFYETLSS